MNELLRRGKLTTVRKAETVYLGLPQFQMESLGYSTFSGRNSSPISSDYRVFIVIYGTFKMSCSGKDQTVKIFGHESVIDPNYQGKRNHTVRAETDGLLLELDRAELENLQG